METLKTNAEIVSAFEVAIGEWVEQERSKPFAKRDHAKIRRLNRVLRNPGMLNALAVRYESEIVAAISDNEEGRFFEIIKWIIENQEQVLSFLMALFMLFGG